MRTQRFLALFAAFLLALPLLGQNKTVVRFGVDASVDCFLSMDNKILPSFGLGARARLGDFDQWLNLVGGVRYLYGPRLSGFQVPVLLNANLVKGARLSGYLGGGFEFDFFGRYYGAAVFQTGLSGRHSDFRVFYKPYQGDLGAGFTYYF